MVSSKPILSSSIISVEIVATAFSVMSPTPTVDELAFVVAVVGFLCVENVRRFRSDNIA